MSNDISARLSEVRAHIAEAELAAGRPAGSVRLVAVSKLHPVEAIRHAVEAGQLDFGENYAQELRDKAREVKGVRWHVIGALQRNKVKYVVGVATLIHTVDTPSLAEEIARRAEVMGIRQQVLVEVNVAGEAQKSGCSRDDLPDLIDRILALPSLDVRGLMCIPPSGTPEQTRPHFRTLRELVEQERARNGLAMPELSMGMSSDFQVAIAEGATLVRVGTAIFGERIRRADFD